MMGRCVYRIALAGFLGGVAVPAARAGNPAVQASETNIAIGISGEFARYHENIGQRADSETGPIGGFTLRASRLGSGGDSAYAALIYEFSGGFLNYNGSTQDGSAYDVRDRAFLIMWGYGWAAALLWLRPWS